MLIHVNPVPDPYHTLKSQNVEFLHEKILFETIQYSQINADLSGSESGSTKLEATKKVKFCEYFL
jgi:hypothetical protein